MASVRRLECHQQSGDWSGRYLILGGAANGLEDFMCRVTTQDLTLEQCKHLTWGWTVKSHVHSHRGHLAIVTEHGQLNVYKLCQADQRTHGYMVITKHKMVPHMYN